MKKQFLLIIIFSLIASIAFTQRKKKNKPDVKPKEKKEASFVSALKLRNVGPSFCSGRIADIEVHPDNENHWYVAVGSGGVWETKNAGTTWKPIFDNYTSYSTGCITIDPNNTSTIWLGTGENVGGRHVGFGDGIYRSTDGGASWKNMGLKKSEHLSEIIVHPENSNVVYVASQGPLWSKGGERGLYKTIDGGQTWKQILGDNEWVGVTDIELDPRDPELIYAATWQRHRTVAAFMGGGPGSGLHRSRDGGATWEKLTSGIPKSNLGKIGFAISPQKPDVIYAAIETDRRKGGLYKSTNQGASWSKMSNAISGGTGPHYYQELYACPHNYDRIYLMDVRIQVSNDGGKNFNRLQERNKHSDNHEIVFRKDDPDYLLIGTDGGIYESLDLAQNWKFIDNLPLTQYYKVAVDDRLPFYHIYGGTQDNGSHAGPSQTDDNSGIRNADWYKTLGADGHQSATEPGNPDIIYAETQQGGMHRIDLKTGEQVYIQPQPGEGEVYERFNWDAPIIVSPHNPSTIFFASQRVWRSDNRGDSWTAISDDLSRNENRIELEIMGKKQSWDNPWDNYAMSNYNSITSLAQSPIDENIIYAGTDDGIIQVTEDGGKTWRKIMASSLSGVPDRAFVNDIKADLYDPNVVYVALDDHKNGTFKPYIYKSTNKGMTWTSLKSNLPDRTLVWRMVQDHVDKDLLFLATEFGIYASLNGGQKWEKVKGAPTISFRDIVIQKRESDLVAASFGRGFFVLDDYSILRKVEAETMKAPATLLTGRPAKIFSKRSRKGNRGAEHWSAKNPNNGAVFTYNVNEEFKSMKSMRQKKEKDLIKAGQNVPFVGYDEIEKEKQEVKPKFWFTIKDADGNIIRKLSKSARKGIGQITWDLRHTSKRAIQPGRNGEIPAWMRRFNSGHGAAPGTYTVTMSKEVNGVVTELVGPQSFEIEHLRTGTLKGKSADEIQKYALDLISLQTDYSAISNRLDANMKKLSAMEMALQNADVEPGAMNEQFFKVKQEMLSYSATLFGNSAKGEVGEKNNPTIGSRMGVARRGLRTSYGPTDMHAESLRIAKKELGVILPKIVKLDEVTIPGLEDALRKVGAPYISGQKIPKTSIKP
jgi:photosystem II stability/assembly factor-like uncharacterized protein